MKSKLLFTTLSILSAVFIYSAHADADINNTSSESIATPESVEIVADNIEAMRFKDVNIHTIYGISNSHIVETKNALYLIDAQMRLSDAQKIKKYIDTLSKPLKLVVISHNHPDHWFGAQVFKGMAPIVSSQNVQNDLQNGGQRFINILKDKLKDNMPTEVIELDDTIALGKHNWDGLEIEINEYLEHESHSSIAIKMPTLGVIIGQDLFYNKAYLVASERERNNNWINILKTFQSDEFQKQYPIVMTGHGKNGTPEIYSENIAYLNKLESLLSQGLSKQDVRAAIKAQYPEFIGDNMLDISMNNLFSHKH